MANSVTVPPELAGLVSKAGSPVRGPFGAGRLVHTNLFNAIVTDNGMVAVGAVTAPALESALSSAH